ncbi:pimeloyl-ACP methyl ester carboxylesterase [Propionicimonas paludicola]|uniref:prolyl aminopeptidase n=1 Tax=Propionicimonas paludicola TaxID=185243 RepID=A0A2A9CQ82_9ACTN|nr:alpha/beta hydrolase [Propionicimonas paludicola]PFG16498.1 pimeloyl-ACP methyl ester carboxylesterase [Propionicimonas paludicola]
MTPQTARPVPERIARLILAALVGGVFAALWAVIEPRGPVTGVQAVAMMASALVTGWLSGRVAESRLAVLIVPLAHVVTFELVRTSCPLPTAGAAPSGTAFGLVAFALGRLVPWLLAVVPLALGAGWGARRLALRRRWALLAASTALAVLAGWLLIPPAAAEVGAPGGFAELVQVELGGHRQWIQVRGTNRTNPVVLYLSGGPGQSDQAFSRVLLEPLLGEITLVSWDQRGTGKSYPGLDQASLTPDRAVGDVVELAQFLAERFGQRKIVLLGESWGSLLAVLAVQRAPQLFSAYLGSGQMVDVLATDQAIYDDLAALAGRTGDAELAAQLARLGRPPYRSVFDYGEIMLRYPLLEGPYTPPAGYRTRASQGGVGPLGVLGVEYAPIEKLNVVRGLLDMFSVMYPQLQSIDLRQSATELEVPVFILCGDHELEARTGPAREWFATLTAPTKRWYQLPDAGHSVAFEQAEELGRILREDVPRR